MVKFILSFKELDHVVERHSSLIKVVTLIIVFYVSCSIMQSVEQVAPVEQCHDIHRPALTLEPVESVESVVARSDVQTDTDS